MSVAKEKEIKFTWATCSSASEKFYTAMIDYNIMALWMVTPLGPLIFFPNT